MPIALIADLGGTEAPPYRSGIYPVDGPSKTARIDRKMRVRIFMDTVAAVVEERVNHWLEHEAGNSEIIKTETTAAVAAPGSDGRSYPYIIVTIWFEGR